MTVTKSTQLITDLGTLQSTAPTSATILKASTAGTDYAGMVEVCNQGAAELKRQLTELEGLTDAADGNLGLIENLLAELV